MRLLLALFVASSLFGCGGPSADPREPVLRFSAIPDEKPTEQMERFRPVAKYLSSALGVKVEYVSVSNYSASVQAFKNGDIQFAWFGGLSGVQARAGVSGSHAIAQGVEDPNFFSYFIAHKDSGLTPSDQFPAGIKGKKFTFGSEGSTSGRLMPEFFIRKLGGAAPRNYFASVGFSGNHPATLAAVNSGSFDVGALSYTTYDNARPEAKADTIVLWKTPPYADYNLTAHPAIDEEFGAGVTDRLKAAWLAMPKALCETSFSRSGMIAAQNADFQAIEETAKSLDLHRRDPAE
jgi:phosphonate transport system substrate-binding protein